MIINPRQKNVTRRSPSIPRKLFRTGAVHLLPMYYLLRLSDLGREGIERSGSYAFADHIYRAVPSGRNALGRWIDARLLQMPAARAFRRRCEYAAMTVRRTLESRAKRPGVVRVLGVPCGIPRDMIEVADALRTSCPGLLERIEYHGLDIDPEVLTLARAMTGQCGFRSTRFHRGDALAPAAYPSSLPFDIVVSTGFGEFLDDEQLSGFFRTAYDLLAPGGVFYTSASSRDSRSDVLLQMAELIAVYRGPGHVERLLRQLPWSGLDVVVDSTGFQTFVTATK